MNKKGQIGTLQALVIALVVIGIVLALGFLIIDEFKEVSNTETVTVTMEKVTTPTNVTGNYTYVEYNSTTSTIPCRENVYSATLLAAYNATTGSGNTSIVTSGNFTLSTTGGFLVVGAPGEWNGTTLYINYSYVQGDDACEAIEDAETALEDIPTWFVIIVVIFIVGIVLAIVFGVLPKPSGESFSGSSGAGGFFKGIFKRGGSEGTAEI